MSIEIRRLIDQVKNIGNIIKEDIDDATYELLGSQHKNDRIIISNDDEIIPRKTEQVHHPERWYGVWCKPDGLWYSFGDGWAYDQRVSGGSDRLGRNAFILKADESKILKITTKEEMKAFEDQFLEKKDINHNHKGVVWSEVAKHYSGIEFLWHYNRDSVWQGMIGLNSGCIWDPGAVISVEKIIAEPSLV